MQTNSVSRLSGTLHKMTIIKKKPTYKNTNEFPFQLIIKCVYPEKKNELIKCTATLRFIPGRRKVLDAIWNDRNVIVKLFMHKVSAKRHLNREWKGLTTLSRSEIDSPEPLFFGQTEAGHWAIVVEKISDSSTALEIFHNTKSPEMKLDLLSMICTELALQHNAGILQKDFHLGNFLLSGEKIFALDPAQMTFYKHQVPKNKSISNFAMLLLCLPNDEIVSRQILCKQYFQTRGLQFHDSDERLIRKYVNYHKKRGIKHGLKKSLRNSKNFHRIEVPCFSGIFDKSFCTEAESFDFMKQIDSLMEKGNILKDSNTCFISHLKWNKNNIVIKRYNHRGIIHSLRHTIIKSRARRVWIHAQRLTMLGIPTPKPMAFIEQHRGLILWNSYYISEYTKGTNLHNFLNGTSVSEEQKKSVIKQVEKLLEKTGDYLITHGDLKHSNILITENGPVLTDLDAMQAHKSRLIYKMKRAKDIKRFQKK